MAGASPPLDGVEDRLPGGGEVIVAVSAGPPVRPEAVSRHNTGIEPLVAPFALKRVSSRYGMRADPFNGRVRLHGGLDLPGAYGTPVRAACGGSVTRAGWSEGYGNLVEVQQPDGMAQRYAHLSSFTVRPGDRITQGQLLGHIGSSGRSTGAHLHFEMRKQGIAIDPIHYLLTGGTCAATPQIGNTDGRHVSAFARARDGALVSAARNP